MFGKLYTLLPFLQPVFESRVTMGQLTTHVLDTMNGCPAAGMLVALYRMDGEQPTLIKQLALNHAVWQIHEREPRRAVRVVVLQITRHEALRPRRGRRLDERPARARAARDPRDPLVEVPDAADLRTRKRAAPDLDKPSQARLGDLPHPAKPNSRVVGARLQRHMSRHSEQLGHHVVQAAAGRVEVRVRRDHRDLQLSRAQDQPLRSWPIGHALEAPKYRWVMDEDHLASRRRGLVEHLGAQVKRRHQTAYRLTAVADQKPDVIPIGGEAAGRKLLDDLDQLFDATSVQAARSLLAPAPSTAFWATWAGTSS